jgi:RNA polymerase sigma-70 factor (ECF subfamily)
MGTFVAHTPVGHGIVGFQADTGKIGVNPEERALIHRLRAGEDAAYETLIDRYEQPVFNLLSRLLDDPAGAADAAQEVFLKVFRNVGSFRGDSSLKTWIYRIAVNESHNQRRWFGRHRKREVAIDPAIDVANDETGSRQDWVPDPGRSPLELAMDREQQALIERALSEINPNFRAVLVLREIEALNYDEIAEILGLSLGTVKSRILRGREALRQRLTEHLKPSEPARSGWRPRTVVAE